MFLLIQLLPMLNVATSNVLGARLPQTAADILALVDDQRKGSRSGRGGKLGFAIFAAPYFRMDYTANKWTFLSFFSP